MHQAPSASQKIQLDLSTCIHCFLWFTFTYAHTSQSGEEQRSGPDGASMCSQRRELLGYSGHLFSWCCGGVWAWGWGRGGAGGVSLSTLEVNLLPEKQKAPRHSRWSCNSSLTLHFFSLRPLTWEIRLVTFPPGAKVLDWHRLLVADRAGHYNMKLTVWINCVEYIEQKTFWPQASLMDTTI